MSLPVPGSGNIQLAVSIPVLICCKPVWLVSFSDCAACVAKIKAIGPDESAAFMATRRRVSLPRRGQKIE